MQRFYLHPLSFKDDLLVVHEPRMLHQVAKVLRMKAGDQFKVFDGQREFLVVIGGFNKKSLELKKVEEIQNEVEPNLRVNLFQAIPKKPALFELIVQKATEIGVHRIFPLITERTENKRPGKDDRLHWIALEAAEQSGRLHAPPIHEPVKFDSIVTKIDNKFLAYENEIEINYLNLFQNVKNTDEINLFIGPEGGFSPSEIELAKHYKAQTFSLGRRILRTETAAMAALSLFLVGR